jgi:hypothetical protein
MSATRVESWLLGGSFVANDDELHVAEEDPICVTASLPERSTLQKHASQVLGDLEVWPRRPSSQRRQARPAAARADASIRSR